MESDEEVKAVQIMASAMQDNPQSYTLLHAQCDFLRSKGKTEWALKLARQAVNCAPSEFVTWEKLTEVYTELEQYESVCFTFIVKHAILTCVEIIGLADIKFMSNVHIQWAGCTPKYHASTNKSTLQANNC